MIKKWMICTVLAGALLLGGCGAKEAETDGEQSSTTAGTDTQDNTAEDSSEQNAVQQENAAEENAAQAQDENGEVNMASENRQIRVSAQDGSEIIFELNDSSAASDLYEQLPLSVEIEDFSDNEKIFYPEELDISDTPLAGTEIGTLAYYAPWGDVVMFYGEYSEKPSLYELGHVVSGGEVIPELTGTVMIEAVL